MRQNYANGDFHEEYQKIQKDEIRDNYLENLGFTVLSFENRFVFPINHPGRNQPL
ncbi:MAG TPA: hypothetical protein DDY34_13610 [Bacteroidales bacterium]|nr:hypothetical protein [Bacteroidales bacterium]HBQ82217.1 hypothetical protein [Bacteroidales bacterium]